MNLHTIKKHNKERSSYRMEINDFADKTLRERQQFTGLANFTSVHKRASTRRSLYLRDAVPDAYDHRDDRHVTEVHNQGNCGSCWTYGVVYPLEGAVSILSGKAAVELSQQEILSCAYEDEEDRNGCNGGWYMDGWDYVRQSGRLATLADEPYLGIDMHCDPYKITGSISVRQSESAHIDVLQSASIGVAFEVTDRFFQYGNEIMKDTTCRGHANHAVTMVGYARNYVLVKNSWGTNWGDRGFVRFARGYHNCQLFKWSSYPRLQSTGGSDSGSDSASNYKPPDGDDPSPGPDPKPDPNCKDVNSGCSKWKSYCKSNGWVDYMKKYCAKTCNYCDGGDDGGDCPSGTVRCPDGVCGHEHMC